MKTGFGNCRIMHLFSMDSFDINNTDPFLESVLFVKQGYFLQTVSHFPDALQVLLQVSKQLGFPQVLAQVVQFFIFALQQGVLAKEIENIVNNIIVVIKRNFFMI